MRSSTRIELVVAALIGLACGGGGQNVAACERFVEHWNALPCSSSPFDQGHASSPEPLCTSSLDLGDCDVTAYFECLETETRCDGDRLIANTGACAMSCAAAPP